VAEQALAEQVPGYVPWCDASIQQEAVLQATELPQVPQAPAEQEP
jgi:hypothetical protein